MVFALPHGGHGGGGVPVLLEPFVEYPPFNDALTMQVAADDCLNLREGPHIEAPVKPCLPDGTRVDLIADPSGDGCATWVDSSVTGYWLYVQAPAARGWVNSAYLAWLKP
jgi:hypothetical protein